ncbi:T9SS type A sorting domain-containing protein [uncultured Tenacibaculum sp.]|uniref:T9SS type A sorting domain-containing protein n=1 Tax=uncultured Tenacibaculum sp. TaxID=174713 RepID=UPI002613BC76|nr:T9SS type A sorting domain-containing protein [uncultured Tenacibaculum sp.]
MNLKLLRGSVLTLLVLGIGGTLNAQNLKPSPNQKKIKKSQVYKNQKMFDSKTGATNSKTPMERQADNAIERAEYEFERLKNPLTGKIPEGIRKAELKFATKITPSNDLRRLYSRSSNGSFSNWQNRGPFNVGGRTRALAIDRTNENIILAGGVSGGLWRSENNGETWRKVTRSFQSPSITTIVQDPRPNKGYIWYFASGERLGNSAGAGGGFYQGSGVYKSQDQGRTWELLRATRNENVGGFESSFDLINSIAVNPTNGDLYVATFDGLFRSQDGGNSFTEVLAGGFDNTVEVSITSTGRIYATIDSGGTPNAGFFTSTDGDNWTNITPLNFPADYGRTVMGIDPSNEDTVYFFSADPTDQDRERGFLFRYDNSAASLGEAWVDLTSNIPLTSIGGNVGNVNIQGGYNMLIKVHPTDSNIVFLGATNVYRSTTGFTTPAGQESWIAGYSPLNNVSLYTNQHPDQHALVFYPSNPNRVLSGNDGGVFISEDITANNPGIEPVEWTSLNNGYITTQPYHVAFDPEANSDDLVAGFQDNGTWFTNSTASNATWEEDFGGDGAYSAIANNGRTRYVSSQRGNVFRLNFDENGEFESFTSVRPAGPGNNDFSFINPFILDPNKDNIMYMPIQGRIWRNINLDGIPLFSNGRASVNWVSIETSQTPAGSRITSLDISKFPVANKLYYGTNTGIIYRMDNANIDNQPAIDISSGKGLPNGFVNDINVDPSNSDRVIVTFSNYGIPSVFFTEDAGETWINISGNLEERPDGSGNGPSVRSTAFLGSKENQYSRNQKIFAATSTGLYYTDYLNGRNTVWRKENNAIGNAVTDEVVTRKDGFIAVASHGNGLFSARFPITANPLPEVTLSNAFLIDNVNLPKNSPDTEIDITGLFVQSENLPIEIEVTNTNTDLVTATLNGNTLTLSYTPDAIGVASIGLIASSNGEQVSTGFTVTISEVPIYEQNNEVVSSIPSQNFVDFNGVVQAADDFTIPEGNSWVINRILAFGGNNGVPNFSSVDVIIYNDNDGVPGDEVYNTSDLTPISELNDPNLNLLLPEALTLESGNYWISIYVNLPFLPTGNQWFWSSEDNRVGQVTLLRDPANLFGRGALDWTPSTVALGRAPIDQTFQIFGDIISLNNESEDVQQEASLASIDGQLKTLAWPNPSDGVFYFNLQTITSDDQISISVFDISGKVVHQKQNVSPKSNYVWDASNVSSGIYLINIKGEKTAKRFKIIKK